MYKYSIITLILISFFFTIKAQDKVPVDSSRTLGVSFKSADYFGFVYKIKKRDYSLRFETFTLTTDWKDEQREGTDDSGIDYTIDSWDHHISLGLTVGLEKQQFLAGDLDFIHGPFLTGSFSYRDATSVPYSYYIATETYKMNVGMGYIGGILYKISKHFAISSELLPRLRYQWRKKSDRDLDPNDPLGIEGGKSRGSELDFMIRNTAKISILYNF
jgi:long-subunit fatty acid transport protein